MPEVDLTRSDADSLYAPIEHKHKSTDFESDETTVYVGSSTYKGRLVRLDNSGRLMLSKFNTYSDPKQVVSKEYVDGERDLLIAKIETLEQKIATLESRSGQVKDVRTERWLDVGVYPNGQMPSNTANRIAFEEE